MANLTEIPEWVKAMYSLFGERCGRRLGRMIVIFILCGVISGGIFGIIKVIGAAIELAGNLSPGASNVLLSILGALILVVGMASISLAIAIFVAVLLRVGLAAPMQKNIESALEQTEAVLVRAQRSEIQSADIDKLLSDLNKAKGEWETSRITRATNWITNLMGRKKKSK